MAAGLRYIFIYSIQMHSRFGSVKVVSSVNEEHTAGLYGEEAHYFNSFHKVPRGDLVSRSLLFLFNFFYPSYTGDKSVCHK